MKGVRSIEGEEDTHSAKCVLFLNSSGSMCQEAAKLHFCVRPHNV